MGCCSLVSCGGLLPVCARIHPAAVRLRGIICIAVGLAAGVQNILCTEEGRQLNSCAREAVCARIVLYLCRHVVLAPPLFESFIVAGCFHAAWRGQARVGVSGAGVSCQRSSGRMAAPGQQQAGGGL